MILPFSQLLNGKQTFFVEKIIKLLPAFPRGFTDKYYGIYDLNVDELIDSEGKLHTIRVDAKKRWKAGKLIHAVINNRIKNKMLQFAPTMQCKRTQKILIEWRGTTIIVRFSTRTFIEFNTAFAHDLSNVNFQRLQQLSVNDGFDTVEYFLQYFSAGIEGKLIHWTGLKY